MIILGEKLKRQFMVCLEARKRSYSSGQFGSNQVMSVKGWLISGLKMREGKSGRCKNVECREKYNIQIGLPILG